MKRIGYLFDKIISYENLELAHYNASKGKQHYKEVQEINSNLNYYLSIIQKQLIDGTYKTSEYIIFKRQEGHKIRTIYKLPYFPDRIVQWAIIQVIEPYILKKYTKDTYSSIKGRGPYKILKDLKRVLHNDPKNTKYCLKLDIKHYYQNIDHELLKQTYHKIFKDKRLLFLIDEIIDSVDTNENGISNVGIPIGNYLSQYSGNIFLSDIDHWLKEDQHIKYYYRYMDDLVILGKTKSELRIIKNKLEEKLKEKKLILKDNWQIFPIDYRGIDFVGYRFFRDYILLRKSIAINFKRKINKFSKQKFISEKDKSKIEQSIASYNGWLKHCDSYRLANKYISKLNIQNVKK